MPKKTKLAKGRLDKFYWLAKEQGFKSRAAFKLIQINKKFNFLQNAKCCIDLCAAPGGWTQVCSKFMPMSSLIVAVDIVKMSPVGGCQTIQGDITLKKTETAVKKVLVDWEADCVLNDGAPNVGGAWAKDAYGQCELTLYALKFATRFLRKDGVFVTKVFRSSDYNALLWCCQQLFKKVSPFKPASSRMSSAETFFVCEGYLKPKKIDSRLLDPSFVFKDIESLSTLQNVLSRSYGKKPNREGYAEGQSVLWSEYPIRKWIESKRPVDLLAKHNKLSFDESDSWLLERAGFEVKEMCADLKLLGKRDFRKLLKWRLKINKLLEAEKPKEAPEPKEEEEEEDEEEMLKQKMDQELKDFVKKKRKDKKKRRRKKLEARRKMVATSNHQTPNLVDDELFSASQIKDLDTLERVLDGEYSEVSEEEEESDTDQSDVDELAALEAQLDEMYESYKKRKGHRNRLRAKDMTLSEVTEEDVEKFSDGEEIQKGVLVNRLKDTEKPLDKADRWFAQSIFNQVEEEQSKEEEDDEEDNEKMEEEEEDDDELELVEDRTPAVPGAADSDLTYKQQRQNAKNTRSRRRRLEREAEKTPNNLFVEVSQDEDWTEDESDAIAEVLAMGQEMLSKKKRERMIDNSYNRYSFDDPEDLPAWFVEEERQHRTPTIPVTKAQVMEYKRHLKAVNARPIKKVAEAKARKKRRAMKAWEKMKKQASSIVQKGELTERQKSKAVQKLYNKMNRKNKSKKPTLAMVSTKGGTRMQRKGRNVKGAKRIRVDGRMKKDKLREKRKAKRGIKRKGPIKKGGKRRRRY